MESSLTSGIRDGGVKGQQSAGGQILPRTIRQAFTVSDDPMRGGHREFSRSREPRVCGGGRGGKCFFY